MLIEISDLSTYQQTGERDDPIPKETETHTKRRKDKTEKKTREEEKTNLTSRTQTRKLRTFLPNIGVSLSSLDIFLLLGLPFSKQTHHFVLLTIQTR
jgi:hypothetical protein